MDLTYISHPPTCSALPRFKGNSAVPAVSLPNSGLLLDEPVFRALHMAVSGAFTAFPWGPFDIGVSHDEGIFF